MIRLTFVIVFSYIFSSIFAQGPAPADYLSKQFHADRRNALRNSMPANSVVVVFAYPERVFSADVNYAYHPNPDLYYLSGYKEPDAVLIIFKENQSSGNTSFNELFYVQKRNSLREQWTGRRLGVEGVQNQLGFKQVYNGEEFKNCPIDFSKFDKILYDIFPNDIGTGNLLSLMTTFREKAGIVKTGNKNIADAYNIIANYTSYSNLATRVNRLKNNMADAEDVEFKTDPLLLELVNHPDSATLSAVTKKINSNPSPNAAYHKLIAALREIKTPAELALLRKSVFLSAIAHEEVMKAIEPGMTETELTGVFEYVHKKYGAEGEGYPPIVGAGGNGCILHYIENNSIIPGNQLVLMDVGSEYHGYSADITRTVPANGKFTPEQKAIYELVYNAQEAVFKICKEGTAFGKLNEIATEVLAEGLLKLGVIADRKDIGRYYMHGCSHHMGLDVHDKNTGSMLKENMVITVEPGIYIPKGSPCDPKWWDIGVRIEDDVIIGKTSCENLSAAAPRSISEIEKTVAKKSVLNDLVVPALK